jgi:lipopolysaccharide export system permease protein
MKLNTIISRTVFVEMLPPFGLNLFFFSFIFLVTKILDITNMVVNYQVNLGAFLLLLLYSMPFFLAFITPMSVMMAILLTFLRMSGDNEIVALKACGMSLHRFLVPVGFFCLLGWMLTTVIAAAALPWGNRSYFKLSADLAKKHIDAVIKERTFIDNFDGLMLYVTKIDMQDKSLKDVFIEDQRNRSMSNIIVAPAGRLIPDVEQQHIRLRLFNGSINQVGLSDQTAHIIAFETYEMKLDLKQALSGKTRDHKSIEEMTIWELKQLIQTAPQSDKIYYKAQMKYHEKFALPFACFTLGLLAIPLGMQSRRGKRSAGAIIGIILFLTYYMLLSVGWSFGESGTLPPVVGMWAPNMLMGAIGIGLYWRMIKDQPVSFLKKGSAIFRLMLRRKRQ